MLIAALRSVARALDTIRARPRPGVTALVTGLLGGVLLGTATLGSSATPVAERPASASSDDPVSLNDAKFPEVERESEGDDTPSREPAARGPAAAAAAVDEYEAEAGVSVGAVVLPFDGETANAGGSLRTVQAWSAMKVPVAAAYLDFLRAKAGAPSGDAVMSPERRENLRSALVESTNESIREPVKDMVKALGSDGAAQQINGMLELGGVSGSPVGSAPDPEIGGSLPIGEAQWDLVEAANFYRSLQQGCLDLAAEDRAFLLRQIRAAPQALGWGAGEVFPHESIAYKPGWGPSPDGFVASQFVLVGVNEQGDGARGGYVAAIAVKLGGGDLEAAKPHLRALAERIQSTMGVPGGSAGPTGQC